MFYDTFVIISYLHNRILRGSKEGRKEKTPSTYIVTQEEIEHKNQDDYFTVSPAVKVLYWCMILLWNGKENADA